MPTYEYECSKCGHEFDLFQPITDEAITTCPKELCPRKPWGKGKVKRAIGAGAGLLFRGSGFYTTDYRSESYKQGAKKESESASGSGEKGQEKGKGEGQAGSEQSGSKSSSKSEGGGSGSAGGKEGSKS